MSDDLPEPTDPEPTPEQAPPPDPADPDEGLVTSAKGPRLTRRRMVGLIGAGAALGGLWRFSIINRPVPLEDKVLSQAAKDLIEEAWTGIDPAKVVDVHVHLVGLGKGGTGCFIHKDAQAWGSPIRAIKTHIYKNAAAIWDEERADQVYVERLVDLTSHPRQRGRFLLLAFDKHHTKQGEVDLEATEFYTPNDYVFQVVKQHPDRFLAAGSVHPYRADAIDELRRCRERGAVAIKWLPNAMGMDPADPRCDAYFAEMAKLSLTLITHAGEEQAVHAEEAQELGNPLRLRRALDAGVKVVVAHCASLGTNRDLDAAKTASGEQPRVSSYELFRRLCAETKYVGRLYGGISAMTQFNRCEDPLRNTIASPDLHPRLVNGSDYPLPAIDPLIRTGKLEDLGYITAEERTVINEVFAYDPLEFDFVLKRKLKVTQDGVTHRLPTSAFETAHLFSKPV